MNKRICYKCKNNLPLDSEHFTKSNSPYCSGFKRICKSCFKIERRRFDKGIYGKIRQKIFEMYGQKCNKCGFSDVRALQLDHIYGDGHLDRKMFGGGASTKTRLRIVNGISDRRRYQILCANCNWIKRFENKEFRQAFE